MNFSHLRTYALTYLRTILAGLLLTACPGPDFTPAFFPVASNGDTGAPAPDTAPDATPAARVLEVTKLVIDAEGRETEVPIPEGTQMEVSTGTFLATDPTDIGPRFASTAKFRIVNIGKKDITIQIPPVLGPFTIESLGERNRPLKPKTMFVLRVTFRPDRQTVKAEGPVSEPLVLGTDTFALTGVAWNPRGRVTVDLIDGSGKILRENIDQTLIGDVAVPASPQRAYFQCRVQSCGGTPLPTACQPCVDIQSGRCQLLAIGSGGLPLDEVTAQCAPAHPAERERLLINFGGNGEHPLAPTSRTFAIRNTGPTPLTITAMTLQEIDASRSTGQFLFDAGAVALGADFAGRTITTLPITLPPHEPPLVTTRAFFVVGYSPSDLIGADGKSAGVGTTVTDRSTLAIATEGTPQEVKLRGTTTITDVPPLQVYFKTPTGLKDRGDGQEFAVRGVTAETTDLAIPLFIRAPEGGANAIRIVGIEIGGTDAAAFEWLNTTEEILAKPEASRCTIPLFDTAGTVTGIQTDLKPVTLAPHGFDLKPGAHTTESMPLFGCLNFHRARNGTTATQRQFLATLTIRAQQLGANRQPLRNTDGTIKQSEFRIPIVAVINPRKGKMVLRLTQTMSVMLNPQFPTLASVPASNEMDIFIAEGAAKQEDRFLFLGGVLLDPFDEETLVDESGATLTTPGDGITAIFRAIDTHPVPTNYEDPLLSDYASLPFDGTAPEGKRGYFFDYPNLPDRFQSGGLKIFTSTLSHPGPLVPDEEKPHTPSACEIVDPCTADGQRKFGEGPTQPGKKGVCAYFFTSAGRYRSPAFHTPAEMEGGTRGDACAAKGPPQRVLDLPGTYTLDGELLFEDGAISFWGPTHYHNPHGPLGPVPPLDEVYHVTFTTSILRPAAETPGKNLIPDARVNLSKLEYKVNLNDPTLETPPICPNNTNNMPLGGKKYSTWRYIAPLLVKDANGEIPAGCPEPGAPFTGGSAYLRGRPLDHATGIMTVVEAAKFSADDNLTFAFKDVMVFFILNGWLCDPQGIPEEFEGARCFDRELNERDARSQITIMETQ